VQAGIHHTLVAGGESGERCDQIAVIQDAVGANGLGKREGQTHEQMLALVEELIGNFDLQKQSLGVDVIPRTRLFVLPRLPQIGTITGAIECDFALLTAALRANASVQSRAKTLFFANFADGATQERILLTVLCHPVSSGRIRAIVGLVLLCASVPPG
jgi:hypothetical protein